MKFVAFDIETLNPAPESKDGNYDLGITCIGACIVDGDKCKTRVWHGKEEFGCYSKKMKQYDVYEFVQKIKLWMNKEYDIVSWNGVGFDLRVINTYCDVSQIAPLTIDPFFQMLCEKGYGVGLNTAALGMGVPGKTEGMDGLKAVQMWTLSRDAQEKVLEYVTQDALTTANVYKSIVESGRLTWVSRSGRTNWWRPVLINENGDSSSFVESRTDFIRLSCEDGEKSLRMLTMAESLNIPKPDTSWMSNPWTREEFYGWTGTGEANE